MYELIEHRRLDANAASITFSSIPQNYSDLVIMVSTRINEVNATGEAIYITINGSTANFTNRYLQGDGQQPASSTLTRYVATQPALLSTANTFGNGCIYIPNYAGNTAKAISSDSVSENNGTTAFQALNANLWNVTDPITSVTLVAGTGDAFVANSSATLYGINRRSAIGAPKAIGGAITYSNGHWFHAFTGSGNFVTQDDLTVEALVIAGGGAGGSYYGGGGGAGGISYKSSILMPKNTSAMILVGSGGSGAGATPVPGANGNNSQFQNIISNGGGGGGSWVSSTVITGRAGGSGGGGPMGVAQGDTAAGGSSNQVSTDGAIAFGNAGGTGYRGVPPSYRGGGGGGAGAAGQSTPINNSVSPGSNGGAGLASWSAWAQATSTGQNGFYGGGGGGGVTSGTPGQGGAGGGGAGDAGGGNPVAGMANTGGGGGADTASGLGAAAGGSGIVIIRYPAR